MLIIFYNSVIVFRTLSLELAMSTCQSCINECSLANQIYWTNYVNRIFSSSACHQLVIIFQKEKLIMFLFLICFHFCSSYLVHLKMVVRNLHLMILISMLCLILIKIFILQCINKLVEFDIIKLKRLDLNPSRWFVFKKEIW